jgi:hypothetical protein
MLLFTSIISEFIFCILSLCCSWKAFAAYSNVSGQGEEPRVEHLKGVSLEYAAALLTKITDS